MSVTALQVRLRFAPDREHVVGRLAMADRDAVFQYDHAFLASGLAISPYNLPLRPGVWGFNRSTGMELFGVFEDSMPDSWGRRVIDRHFQKTLKRPPTLLERLAFVGERAMGALTFHPPEEAAATSEKDLNLARLAEQAWDFDAEKVEDALPELRRVAGTSGGARPKALLGLSETSKKVLPGDVDLPAGYSHWIVKFNSRTDVKDAGPLEFAYAEIAATAGAEVPARRLIQSGKHRFFATRRFDRPAHNKRLHMHSVAGLLHANFRTAGMEYKELFRLTDALTHDYSQKRELFRRACLNVLACNRDDHLKNFAFLMASDGKWRLSPLYDFTFHLGPNGWHTLSIAGEGEHPGLEHLLKLSKDVDLVERDAKEIIDAVRSAVAGFDRLAKKLKLSKRTVAQVKSRLKG
jgi:serine/threonine-protein kinase HipA